MCNHGPSLVCGSLLKMLFLPVSVAIAMNHHMHFKLRKETQPEDEADSSGFEGRFITIRRNLQIV